MPGLSELMSELNQMRVIDSNGNENPSLRYQCLRRRYIENLHKTTGRNVITYYSGWLWSGDAGRFSIDDSDMIGFMEVAHGMDFKKGLDLVLHTPGGSPTATEGLVKYLHGLFGSDIRVMVPHMAMSAGTMLACSAREIIMGLHSVLGPIDPQWLSPYGLISSYNVLREFNQAANDLKTNPEKRDFWDILLGKYPPTVRNTACDAIKLAGTLTADWLENCMFEGDPDASGKSRKILKTLNKNNGSHSRHFSMEDCLRMGLKVKALEDDDNLQDAVLSLHHCYVISFNNIRVSKLIESNMGKSYRI